ncbi:MAG TPA: phosphatase PAP2 family protein [Terracidiphilus sp.]|nr:phosphatase PAP2 family protein [Terracidiphilus sp.]
MVAALCALVSNVSLAQSAADAAVLRGLSPVSVLLNTDAGKSALAANYTVTGRIQTGAIVQPTLLPFPQQEQQALRDAFITFQNLSQLSDGLGTALGSAYVARFHYIDQKRTSRTPPSIDDLIRYALVVSGRHSGAAKYLFANETTDGKKRVSTGEAALITEIGGVDDVFGKAYKLPAGTAGAGAFGNARPYQTEPSVTSFDGPDYLNRPAGNYVYNHGPAMDLTNSPSYPSGHTTYGYTGAVLLAVLVPERYAQMIARGAEYGNDRVIMGSHYVMDVLGGRALALYDMAHLLANDTAYMGLTIRGVPPVKDFRGAVKDARVELRAVLQSGCGNAIDECSKEDTGRFSNAAADETFYDATQTYNLPVVYPEFASEPEDVSKVAPEAGYLLTVAFPALTLNQADQILTDTEGPGGGFLDNGSGFGVYSRLNLYAAAQRAAQVVRGR